MPVIPEDFQPERIMLFPFSDKSHSYNSSISLPWRGFKVDSSRNLAVLKQRTEKVSYPIETDYTDDSKSILTEIQDEADDKIENCSSDSENEESSVEFQ